VFSSLFFEAFLIAHGTHEHSQKFVSGGTVKFEAEEWARGSWSLGEGAASSGAL